MCDPPVDNRVHIHQPNHCVEGCPDSVSSKGMQMCGLVHRSSNVCLCQEEWIEVSLCIQSGCEVSVFICRLASCGKFYQFCTSCWIILYLNNICISLS
jgi:hypothetical protein